MTEIKYAARSLFKAPGFTIAAIVTIALGIAANTALFSVFDALVLNPIALPNAGQLVRVWTNNKARNVAGPVLSVPKFRLIAEQQTVFTGIAASAFNTVVITRDGIDPEQLTGLNVTSNFVPTLGLKLARGRNFSADEDKLHGPHVCILSYDVWKTRFGLNEKVLGSTIQLDGVGTQVVGILAEGLPTPISFAQVLQPWPFNPAYLNDQQIDAGAGFMQATARLTPGVSIAKADAQIRAIAQRYEQMYPGRLDANAENELRTWIDEQGGPVRATMLLLLSAVGLVLLIACGNVSNLFLGRLSSRQKEVAVRLSLGSTRRRLVGRFLLESAIFCVVAGAVGVALAVWGLHGAERVFVNQLQTPIALPLNWRTLFAALGLSALSSLLTGLVPALHGSRVNLSDVLRENARGSVGSGRGTRFRSALIVSEVSLSVILLVGSALVLAGFFNLRSTRAGFSPDGIASVFVNPGPQHYPTRTERVSFFYQVLDKLKTYPQVKAAAVTQGLPLTQNNPRGVYSVFGRPIPPVSERPVAYLTVATEDYFTMLRIPLLRGRLFQSTDIEGGPIVCLLNESFAKQLFHGEDPLGKFILLGAQGQTKVEIVGIVGDVRTLGLNTPPPETIYNSLRQIGGVAGQSIVASTDGDPALLEPLLRSAVEAVDKSQAVSAFATLNTQLAQSLGIQRVTAWLTGVFAVIALLLSTLGLYSVLAYAVTQRTGEIGVRVALGANPVDIVRLIVGHGMRLVVLGLAIGLVFAAVTSRLLSSVLYGVPPLDPTVFASVAALFGVVSIIACFVPSLRASRIDALVALRAD